MASLKDISEATGVSIRTVNRALKSNGYVGEETRIRVLEAAERLDYRPNLAARSLRTGQSYEIGVIMGSTDELHMEKMMAFEQVLRAAEYSVHVLFAHSGKSVNPVGNLLDDFMLRRSAAVALFPGAGIDPAEAASVFHRENIPYVCIDTRGVQEVDTVWIDRSQGVYEAIHYLARTGRKRIAFLGQGHVDAHTRLPGYKKAIKQLGQKPLLMLVNPDLNEFEMGRTAATEFCALSHKPDAVQAHSDAVAMGFLSGLHEQGVRIPDDVAVVGFDDRRMASCSWPRLTTIRQPNMRVGRAAAKILLSKIQGEPVPPKGWSQSLPTELIVRETT